MLIRRLLALCALAVTGCQPYDGEGNPHKLYGFAAEQVADVIPELVGLDAEGRPNSVRLGGDRAGAGARYSAAATRDRRTTEADVMCVREGLGAARKWLTAPPPRARWTFIHAVHDFLGFVAVATGQWITSAIPDKTQWMVN